jgi:D-sedoheptulose 7-phosphate isomerase
MDSLAYGFSEHRSVLDETEKMHSKTLEKIADLIVCCFNSGGQVIIFGNGGSYSDACHFAGELEGTYKNRKRPALRAIVPANSAAQTAISNDFGYEKIFKRFVQAFATSNDIVIGLTTSGNSANVIEAYKTAKEKGAKIISFTGKSGGMAKDYSDILYNVPSDNTPRIQEMHELAYHEICEKVEKSLFG